MKKGLMGKGQSSDSYADLHYLREELTDWSTLETLWAKVRLTSDIVVFYF